MKKPWILPAMALAITAATPLAATVMPAGKTTPVGISQDDGETKTAAGVVKEYEAAYAEFNEAYQAAEDDESRQAAIKLYPDAGSFVNRVIEIAKKAPAGDDALTGVAWIIQEAGHLPAAVEAWKIVAEHHVQCSMMGTLCSQASMARPNEELVDCFQRIIDESDKHDVQGFAIFALAMQYKGLVATIKDDQEEVSRIEAEFVGLMEEVKAVYHDLPHYKGSLGKAVEGELFEFKNLRIGMVAPDIEGGDTDGVSFKLSDYRGKVVVLDFWGNW